MRQVGRHRFHAAMNGIFDATSRIDRKSLDQIVKPRRRSFVPLHLHAPLRYHTPLANTLHKLARSLVRFVATFHWQAGPQQVYAAPRRRKATVSQPPPRRHCRSLQELEYIL